jgi:hypothetical protein
MNFPHDAIGESIDLRLRGDARGAVALLTATLESLMQSGQLDLWPHLAHNLAAACEEDHRPELGIRYLQECLTTFPDDLSLLYALTKLLIASGRRDEAQLVAKKFRSAFVLSTDDLRHNWAELQEPLERVLAERGS